MKLVSHKNAAEIRAMYARLQKKGFGFDELLKAWSEYYDAEDIQRVVEQDPGLKSKKAKKRAERESAKTKTKWSGHPVLHWRERWRAVADAEQLPPVTRLVLWEISAHMKNNGTGAYPGFKRIAKQTGLALSTVVKHVDLAVDLGWLRRTKVTKQHGKGWLYATAFPKEHHK